MPWFRLDDQGAFHTKTVMAGNEAYGAWTRAGQWSSGHGTEGFIPESIALTIGAAKLWKRLVTVGLCEDADGGWMIHDFLDWNPTVEEAERKRMARAEAGRRGGYQKASKRLAMAQQTASNGLAIARDVASGLPSKRLAKSCPDPDPDPNIPSGYGEAPTLSADPPRPVDISRVEEPIQEAPKRRRGAKAGHTPCPPTDAPESELVAWATRWRIPPDDSLFVQFVAWHRKGDKRWKDWTAAWGDWKARQAKWDAERSSPVRSLFARGAEITKQPYDADAPWMNLPEVGS